MKQNPMSQIQKDIGLRHSKNNLVRSIVLLKRAVNALTFADRSLEGIEMLSMTEDIGKSKRSIGDALRVLSVYIDNEE